MVVPIDEEITDIALDVADGLQGIVRKMRDEGVQVSWIIEAKLASFAKFPDLAATTQVSPKGQNQISKSLEVPNRFTATLMRPSRSSIDPGNMLARHMLEHPSYRQAQQYHHHRASLYV